jgi:hypothetical protein
MILIFFQIASVAAIFDSWSSFSSWLGFKSQAVEPEAVAPVAVNPSIDLSLLQAIFPDLQLIRNPLCSPKNLIFDYFKIQIFMLKPTQDTLEGSNGLIALVKRVFDRNTARLSDLSAFKFERWELLARSILLKEILNLLLKSPDSAVQDLNASVSNQITILKDADQMELQYINQLILAYRQFLHNHGSTHPDDRYFRLVLTLCIRRYEMRLTEFSELFETDPSHTGFIRDILQYFNLIGINQMKQAVVRLKQELNDEFNIDFDRFENLTGQELHAVNTLIKSVSSIWVIDQNDQFDLKVLIDKEPRVTKNTRNYNRHNQQVTIAQESLRKRSDGRQGKMGQRVPVLPREVSQVKAPITQSPVTDSISASTKVETAVEVQKSAEGSNQNPKQRDDMTLIEELQEKLKKRNKAVSSEVNQIEVSEVVNTEFGVSLNVNSESTEDKKTDSSEEIEEINTADTVEGKNGNDIITGQANTVSGNEQNIEAQTADATKQKTTKSKRKNTKGLSDESKDAKDSLKSGKNKSSEESSLISEASTDPSPSTSSNDPKYNLFVDKAFYGYSILGIGVMLVIAGLISWYFYNLDQWKIILAIGCCFIPVGLIIALWPHKTKKH